ncbi:4-hydroxyphenylacetate 3-hydroxylase N-terminal domain-containing protein, partial [Mangrovicoccus ximenensis]|uniref:4-hydroxyphenylacetate 3-hydroxylase N-terminal domain-containing protein n=1 Tax=Mangrovicoccus ximenensis TaxID=1911570 RepID=UPI000D3B28BF
MNQMTKTMPAHALKTGAEFKASLDDGRKLWVNGRKLDKVTDEPALEAGVDMMASMFDDQFSEEFAEATTVLDRKSGLVTGRSWQVPETIEDLVGRRKMMEYTSRKTVGTFGRPIDLGPTLAVGILAHLHLFKDFKSAFGECQPDFAENVQRYVDYGRMNSITCAESLTGPQNDRSSPMAQAASLLRVVEVEKDGVRISGAKSVGSIAAQTNEIFFSNLAYPGTPKEAAIWGAVPINSDGIKLVSREMLSEPGADPFDHPLTHRGEEADQLVIFDRVWVPKNRIFNLGNEHVLEISGKATIFAHYHVLTRLKVKSEIFVGCAQMVVDMLGTGGIPAVRSMLAEIIEYNRTLEAFVLAAEANAQVNESGVMCPDVMMLTTGRLYAIRNYPHIIHVLQEMCGQGLVMRFGKASFENPDIGHHLKELLPGKGVT